MRRYGQAASIPIPIPGTGTPELAERGLVALREISHAVLSAERVEDALQFALERISPVVGAAFASVYLSGDDGDLLRLAASYNWPDRLRPWLGAMRVRLGFGPSGEAASERRAIEIADVFADPALEDWQEVAQELGFRALIAVPLSVGTTSLGAATFYFSSGGGFSSGQRDLLRIAADHMSLAADRAALAARARRAVARMTEAEADAERQGLVALEARQMRDEFLTNVSHELRTPLTVLLGTIDLLEEELGGPLTGSQREDLTRAREASTRLLGLVEALLALSAMRKGTLALQVEEFDPRVPLREAVAAAGSPVASVQLAIEEPGTFLPAMRSDREKTRRILVSLLSNAFKFTQTGTVRASVAVTNGRVIYRVIDTGPGIPSHAQSLVFDEFRQLDGSVTRRVGGAGLGLPLARGLARFLGGDVELVSEAGKGTEVVVELPLQADS